VFFGSISPHSQSLHVFSFLFRCQHNFDLARKNPPNLPLPQSRTFPPVFCSNLRSHSSIAVSLGKTRLCLQQLRVRACHGRKQHSYGNIRRAVHICQCHPPYSSRFWHPCVTAATHGSNLPSLPCAIFLHPLPLALHAVAPPWLSSHHVFHTHR
jgi:hypothetical protein